MLSATMAAILFRGSWVNWLLLHGFAVTGLPADHIINGFLMEIKKSSGYHLIQKLFLMLYNEWIIY